MYGISVFVGCSIPKPMGVVPYNKTEDFLCWLSFLLNFKYSAPSTRIFSFITPLTIFFNFFHFIVCLL